MIDLPTFNSSSVQAEFSSDNAYIFELFWLARMFFVFKSKSLLNCQNQYSHILTPF